MRKIHMVVGAAVVAACFGAHNASAATIILQDNFDAETQQLNWPGDAVFRSIPRTRERRRITLGRPHRASQVVGLLQWTVWKLCRFGRDNEPGRRGTGL